MPIAPGLLTCVKTLAVQQQESKAGLQWIFPFVSTHKKKQNAGFTKIVKPIESKVSFTNWTKKNFAL
jgi:hypothetical protein